MRSALCVCLQKVTDDNDDDDDATQSLVIYLCDQKTMYSMYDPASKHPKYSHSHSTRLQKVFTPFAFIAITKYDSYFQFQYDGDSHDTRHSGQAGWKMGCVGGKYIIRS